jgi:hypothetical protein
MWIVAIKNVLKKTFAFCFDVVSVGKNNLDNSHELDR